MKSQRYLETLRDTRYILKLDENNVKGLVYQTAAALALGDRDLAVECLEKAHKFKVNDEFNYVLSEIRIWDSRLPESGAEMLLRTKEMVQESIDSITESKI